LEINTESLRDHFFPLVVVITDQRSDYFNSGGRLPYAQGALNGGGGGGKGIFPGTI